MLYITKVKNLSVVEKLLSLYLMTKCALQSKPLDARKDLPVSLQNTIKAVFLCARFLFNYIMWLVVLGEN